MWHEFAGDALAERGRQQVREDPRPLRASATDRRQIRVQARTEGNHGNHVQTGTILLLSEWLFVNDGIVWQ